MTLMNYVQLITYPTYRFIHDTTEDMTRNIRGYACVSI